MRSAHGVWAAAILAVALGVVAWLWGASGGPEDGDREAPDAAAHGHAAGGADFAGPVLRGAGVGGSGARGGQGAVLTGIVLLDGRPVAAHLTARAVPAESGAPERILGEGKSDGTRGTFTLRVDPPPRDATSWLVAESEGARGAVGFRLDRGKPSHLVAVHLRGGDGRLAGDAVDAEGRPWEGALFVRTAGDRGLPASLCRRTHSAPDGTFAFTNLPSGRACVGADIGGGRIAMGPVVAMPTTEPYRIVVALDGDPLRVRVLRSDDARPVAGARVTVAVGRTAVPWGDSRGSFDLAASVEAVTDAAGLVSLVYPRTGPAWVAARARGHQGDGCEVPPGAREVVLRLAPNGGIAGRVVAASDGRPVPGLRVTSDHLGTSEFRVSDEEGRFRFEDVPPRECRVLASGAGLACVPGEDDAVGVRVTVPPGRVAEVDLRVGPAAVVDGRVLGPDGKPAAGAEVWLREDRWAGRREAMAGLLVAADADGRFRIENVPRKPAPHQVAVCARAPGGGVGVVDLSGSWDALKYKEPWMVSSGPADASAPVEIRIPEPGGLTLTVVDADSGRALPYTVVTLTGPAQDFTGITDERGEVTAEGLSPGAYKVSCDRCAPPPTEPFATVVAGSVTRATVTFRRACEIGATLVWSDGTPVSGGTMRLEVHGRRAGYRFWTDISGSLHHGNLPWDTYEVEISAGTMDAALPGPDGKPVVYARATLEPDTTDTVIRLNRAPIPPLVVTVLDAEGRPLAEGRVRHELRTIHEEMETGIVSFQGERIQDGRVVLEGIDRPVWLEVLPESGSGPTGARTRLGPVAPGTGSLTVRVPPGLEIGGRVVGPAGEPLGAIQVEAWVETAEEPEAWHNRPFTETRTTSDGTFRLDRLPAGPYTLYARVEKGYAPAPEIVVLAGTTDVVLSLVRRVDVEVTVLLPDGTPAPGARVTAFHPGWYGGDGAARATCGPSGVALLRDLDPRSTYLLEVANRHPADQVRELRFPAWSPEATTVRVPQRTRLRIQVVDDVGTPVPLAEVRVRSLEAPEAGSGTVIHDTDGQPVVLDPPPGPWTAVASDATRVSAPHRIEAGAHSARLVLPRTGGRVVVEVEGGISPWVPLSRDHESQPRWILWDEAEPNARRSGRLVAEGRVVVEGLSPERIYSVLIRDPRPDGFVAMATGLSPDGSVRRTVRHALPRLRLRVVEPPDAWVTNVGIVETGETARREGEAWWLPALPPGPFTLWASGERREDRAAVMVRVAFDGVNLPEVVLPAR